MRSISCEEREPLIGTNKREQSGSWEETTDDGDRWRSNPVQENGVCGRGSARQWLLFNDEVFACEVHQPYVVLKNLFDYRIESRGRRD